MSVLGALTGGFSAGSQIGGALGNIFGGNSGSTSNSTTTSNSSSTTNSSGSSSTSSSSSTSYDIVNMTPEGFAAMMRALDITSKLAESSIGNYSKDQAKADALANMGQIFREYRENELPKVFIGQAGGGLYNSTTGQLMANDAYARATDLANARILDYTKAYNQMLTNDLGSFLSALNVNKGSVKRGGESTSGGSSTSSSSTSTTEGTQTSVTKGQQEQKKSSGGLFGSIGGLIGGALSLFT
jgi:hypothetical protein